MFEQERNVLNGSVAVALTDFFEEFESIKWFAILGLILVFCDLRFGILAAKKRGEKIRKSRALRRTINKIVDYICWIILSVAIEHTFGFSLNVPLIPVFIMLVIYGIEINSVYSNYFEYRDIPYRVNVFKWFSKKTDIIDVEDKNNNDTNDTKN
jgi:undecaprenyl pyrophosphate phosphatase UppP